MDPPGKRQLVEKLLHRFRRPRMQLGRRAQGAVGVDLQARLWNRYRELFRATIQAGDAGLPAAFLVAFARAYENIAAGGKSPDPGERE